jgi:hypothetical protein
MARQCILLQVTVKGFKKCCISNAMEGTNDYILRKGSEKVGNIRREEDEGTDCENGDSDTDW